MSNKTCISDNSFILTKKGYIKIKNLIKNKGFDINDLQKSNEINTKICNKKGNLSLAKSLNYNGKNKLYKLTTKTGVYIETTKEHTFYALEKNGEIIPKKLEELKTSDIILSRVGDKIYNNKELINCDDAYLLGFLTASNFLKNQMEEQIKLNVPESLREKIQDLLVNKFDTFVTENNEISIYNSKLSIDIFQENYDYSNEYVSNKILASNIEVQLEYLRGFFDINTILEDNQIKKIITNKQLYVEILLLLKNLGIIAEIVNNELIIRGKEVAIFYNLVSFYNYDYNILINDFYLTEEDFYVIPYIQDIVKTYYNSIEIKNKKYILDENFKYNRENILEIIQMKGNKELKNILESLIDEHICYDEIVKIEEIQKGMCFDFDFIDDNDTYLVNSFITK